MGEPLCDDEVEEDTDAEGVIVPDTVSVGEAESDALTQLDAEGWATLSARTSS